MRHPKTNLIAFAVVLTMAMPLLAGAAKPGDHVPGRYVVQLDNSASADQIAARHGLAPDKVYKHAINGFAGFVPPGRLKALAADPAVLSVAPDRVVSATARGGKKPPKDDPPPVPDPDPDPIPEQSVPTGVTRIGAAPDSSILTGAGVGIAIVDTGIDHNHADLNVSEVGFSAFRRRNNGKDDNGHGTHVAGIAAALDNNIDVVGVAPEATLYAVKVLDRNGNGNDSTVIAGLDWVAENAGAMIPPIRVVNLSLGRPGSLNDSPLLRDAYQTLYALGITIVVSAGNDPESEVSQQVPACYPEVLAIASSTAQAGSSEIPGFGGVQADTASFFTTDGAFNEESNTGVTISAPGEAREDAFLDSDGRGYVSAVGILSTQRGGGTTRMFGTSMASPHVAGIAALLIDMDSAYTPEDIQILIRGCADKPGLSPIDSPTSGYSYDEEREGILSLTKILLSLN